MGFVLIAHNIRATPPQQLTKHINSPVAKKPDRRPRATNKKNKSTRRFVVKRGGPVLHTPGLTLPKEEGKTLTRRTVSARLKNARVPINFFDLFMNYL